MTARWVAGILRPILEARERVVLTRADCVDIDDEELYEARWTRTGFGRAMNLVDQIRLALDEIEPGGAGRATARPASPRRSRSRCRRSQQHAPGACQDCQALFERIRKYPEQPGARMGSPVRSGRAAAPGSRFSPPPVDNSVDSSGECSAGRSVSLAP